MGDIYSTLGDYDNAIAQYQNYLTNQYADPDGAVQMKLGDALLNQLPEEKARHILFFLRTLLSCLNFLGLPRTCRDTSSSAHRQHFSKSR